MIKELIIKNIVLIKYLDIAFNKGLSVLTGETGTGKSILLDSLGLILGNRVDFNLIRKGENEASVTALFLVPDNHIVAQILNKYNINFNIIFNFLRISKIVHYYCLKFYNIYTKLFPF